MSFLQLKLSEWKQTGLHENKNSKSKIKVISTPSANESEKTIVKTKNSILFKCTKSVVFVADEVVIDRRFLYR